MILSIDNKKPNKEELELIKEARCVKCGGEFNHHSPRVIFVNTNNGVLWWHGLDKSKKGAEYLCQSLPVRKNSPFKIVKTCPNCKKKFRSNIKKFCIWRCEIAYYKKLFPS